jgi:hypothetical protein
LALGRIEGHCRNRPRNRRPGQAGYKGYIPGYTRLRQEMKPGPAGVRTLGQPAPPKPVLQPLPQLPCPLLLSLPRLSLLQPLLPRLSLLQPWQRTNC